MFDMWRPRAKPTVGGANPEKVVLNYIRKQDEQAVGTSQRAVCLHGLCISSYIQVPALSSLTVGPLVTLSSPACLLLIVFFF